MHTLNNETTGTALEVERMGVGLMEAWNAHDVEQVMAFYAPHYKGIDVGQATPLHGPDGKRQTVVLYLTAFPDLHFAIEDVIGQDNRVAVSWVAIGTHHGAFMHIPPTGRSINVRGISLLTFAGEQIVSAVYVWDVAALLRDIGMLPDL
jgi:steroid delta-isomerase-like uncharacterized protein